ncbi:putative TetR family transcriptional regulator [Kitasatospora setae KM-6054]|uniref:Putative TetR family transcriptional regulator n=1 Tax=Kitasatospora setae (strain ATCC 33774 / DSM 43861 / JCM 3304 / KCC A-0304 / NBRC 14216 / KM-6054) TaxID=452652 RepID=E4N0Z9_KITSK|nr:putative TetR family transcriptional regulator [Kitasatospora setae KM-6054]
MNSGAGGSGSGSGSGSSGSADGGGSGSSSGGAGGKVEHEERRRQIAEALLRIADTQGLQSASMRAVAAEAGVSLRLVQYYFQSKEGLLLDALARLGAQLQDRMARWIAAADSPPTPRSLVTAVLSCILPTDAESRRITRTYAAYYTLVLNDPELLARHGTGQADLLEGFLAKQLHAARDAGRLAPGRDPAIAAAGLAAMVNGLGQSVLGGQRTGEQALAVLTRHLDELFTP